MNRRMVGHVALVLGAVVLAFFSGYRYGSWQPDCPTEDSCEPRWTGDRWEIVQVIP